MDAALRDAVLARDRACVRCGSTDRIEVHHRLPRAHGVYDTAANLVALCPACHYWVHSINPRAAYDLGLLLHSWDGPPSEPYRLDGAAPTLPKLSEWDLKPPGLAADT